MACEDFNCFAYVLSARYVAHRMEEEYVTWTGTSELPGMERMDFEMMKALIYFEERHRSTMSALPKRWAWSVEKSSYKDYLRMASELIAGEPCWDKVVAVFCFGGFLAVQVAIEGKVALAKRIPDWTAVFVETHLDDWVEARGGYGEVKLSFCGFGINETWDVLPLMFFCRYLEHRLADEGLNWWSPVELTEMNETELHAIFGLKRYDNRFGCDIRREVRDLKWDDKVGYKHFESLVKCTFDDGCNWKKIVALFVFGAYVAMHFVENGYYDSVIDVAHWLTTFTETYLKEWMLRMGGFSGIW